MLHRVSQTRCIGFLCDLCQSFGLLVGMLLVSSPREGVVAKAEGDGWDGRLLGGAFASSAIHTFHYFFPPHRNLVNTTLRWRMPIAPSPFRPTITRAIVARVPPTTP